MLKNVTFSDIFKRAQEIHWIIVMHFYPMQIRTLRLRSNNEVVSITGRINYKAKYLLIVWVEFDVIILNKAKHNV